MKNRAILSAFLVTTFLSVSHASLQSDIGFTQLKQEFGAALPDGSNLSILQVEACDSSGNWAVSKSGEMSTRKITFPLAVTQPSAYSAHANIVATNLTGTTTSILPALGELQVASIGTYRTFSLNMAAFLSPAPVSWDVENHSLISNVTTYNLNALQLLDYRINRDLVTVVIALENGTNAMSPLWGNCYNTIAVGTANGQHSRGGTNLDGSGRMKPDLVGTATYTSYATPVVASSAGLLIAETKRTAALATAKDPRVIKALLMAGATKEPFPTWSQTSAQPLDPIYGTGRVSIYNSYKTLLAGRQTAGTVLRSVQGWDLGQSGTGAVYYFEVPTGQTLKFSTVLTWHRVLSTSDNYWSFTGTPADLNLRLHNSTTSFALGTVVAESASALDNVEHIYQTALPAGRYALEVSGPAGTTYGIAWNGILSGGTTVPPPVVAPVVTTQPVSLSVTEGQPASFTVTASGTSPSYQWAKNAVAIPGATGASYSVAATTLSSAGQYTVNVSNSAGSVSSNAATLAVAAVVVVQPPASGSVELTPSAYSARGQNGTTEGVAKLFDHNKSTKWLDFSGTTWVQVSFTSPRALSSYNLVSANDHPERDPSTWTLSGSNDGVNWTAIETRSAQTFASRLLLRSFALAQNSAAYLYFRFDIACKSSTTTQLADLELWSGAAAAPTVVAPAITVQPVAVSVASGQPASFSVTATGDSLTYQWSKDGVSLTGATAATCSIAATTTASAGCYAVTVTNSANSVTSAGATLTVTPLVGTQPPPSTTLVELIPTTYSARGQNGTTEGIAKLFDHHTSTKWLDFSGTTWVQVSFATPCVLDSYSLTSANDHAERDPANWTLSGSNDGVNWTPIESRSAQIFVTRLLQCDFVLSQSSPAYRYFRFDILCKSGTTTQLADLELWGH